MQGRSPLHLTFELRKNKEEEEEEEVVSEYRVIAPVLKNDRSCRVDHVTHLRGPPIAKITDISDRTTKKETSTDTSDNMSNNR